MGGYGGGIWPSPTKPKPRPVEPDPQMPDPQFPDEGEGTVDRMRGIYTNLRFECAELETLIGRGVFSEQDLKRLDKAVTVMKVGFKMLKKVARKASGGRKLKRIDHRREKREKAEAQAQEPGWSSDRRRRARAPGGQEDGGQQDA